MRRWSIALAAVFLVMILGSMFALQRRGRYVLGRGGQSLPRSLPTPMRRRSSSSPDCGTHRCGARGMWAMRGSWPTDYPKADRQFSAGRPAVEPHSCSIDGTSCRLVRRRYVPLPVFIRSRNRTLGLACRPGGQTSRIPVARRLPDDGRFPRHGGVGNLYRQCRREFFKDRPWWIFESATRFSMSSTILDERFQVPGIRHVRDRATPTNRMASNRSGARFTMTKPRADGDLSQYGPGRRLGVGGYPTVSRTLCSLAYRVGINYIIYSMTH